MGLFVALHLAAAEAEGGEGLETSALAAWSANVDSAHPAIDAPRVVHSGAPACPDLLVFRGAMAGPADQHPGFIALGSAGGVAANIAVLHEGEYTRPGIKGCVYAPPHRISGHRTVEDERRGA